VRRAALAGGAVGDLFAVPGGKACAIPNAVLLADSGLAEPLPLSMESDTDENAPPRSDVPATTADSPRSNTGTPSLTGPIIVAVVTAIVGGVVGTLTATWVKRRQEAAEPPRPLGT